jgi:CheY-like chemotaxis protein
MSSGVTRILLVDDEPANLVALEAVLAPLSAELVRASSASEALRHLLRQEFALVLLDVRMPDMSGIEVADLPDRVLGGGGEPSARVWTWGRGLHLQADRP